jgi:hypothetical protein
VSLIGTVGGTTVTIEFKVQVTSVRRVRRRRTATRRAGPIGTGAAPAALRDGTFGTNTVTTTIAVLDPTKQV